MDWKLENIVVPVDVCDRDDDVLELPVHAYTSEGTPKRSW